MSTPSAKIISMKDTDLSRDTYAVVAARRTQFDQLVWQVPVLSLTAQAFLFSIALSGDATRTARAIASVLSLLMTILSLHLMAKHRQAEVADSHWLESYESQFKPPAGGLPWPMHGPTWSRYRNSVDPKIGLLGVLSRFGGFQVWSWGLAIFGVAAVVVLLLTIIRPHILSS
jgi:disulfide bond formation protein DsbB